MNRHPSLPGHQLRSFCAATLLTMCLIAVAACGKAADGAASIATTPTTTTAAATGAMTTADPSATADPTATAAAEADDDTTAPPTRPAAGKTDIEVCSLLTDAEVHAIIGDNSGGKGGGRECSWENEDNYYSVTIDVGSTGSARGGGLPDPLPGAKTSAGPDGIRYSSGNVAEFLIGDRACQVQVVTSVTDESDRPTAVRIIGLIRSRVKA